MEKRIKDFEDYGITTDGKVISYKYKQPKTMATWYQKGGYENIKLCNENKTYHKLIHRLVAKAFIPNPNNLPEVNHIDKNPQNNNLENLEWCDRKYNLEQSYETMSPTRNFKENVLYRGDEEIDSFKSIKKAAEYASENFGCSKSSMIKYRKCNGYEIRCRD